DGLVELRRELSLELAEALDVARESVHPLRDPRQLDPTRRHLARERRLRLAIGLEAGAQRADVAIQRALALLGHAEPALHLCESRECLGALGLELRLLGRE